MERTTVPENPPRLVMVMSEVACTPAVILTEEEPPIRKSTTFTDIVIECDKDPDVAVTITVKDPAIVEVTTSIELPDPLGAKLTVFGFKLAAVLVVARALMP